MKDLFLQNIIQLESDSSNDLFDASQMYITSGFSSYWIITTLNEQDLAKAECLAKNNLSLFPNLA